MQLHEAPSDALKQLVRVTRSITGALDRDDLLRMILHAAVEVTGAERGFLILMDAKEKLGSGEDLRIGASYQLDASELDTEEFQASKTAILKALGSGVQHHDADAMADPEHSPSVELFGLRSILCENLTVRDRQIGVLYLDSQITSKFNEGHREVLPAFASQAAICIDQADLIRQREDALHRAHERKLHVREMEAWKKAMTAFVSIASHDLKGPLTVLRNGLSILRRMELPQMGREVVEDMESSLHRATRLVEMYLDASALQEGGELTLRLEDVELRLVVDREFQIASTYMSEDNRDRFEFHNHVPEGLRVHVDPDRLHQILGNLIQNAVKHCRQGSVGVKARADDGMVTVSVADTGPGIAPEVQGRIFERYFRGDETSSRGTGVGLWIVRKLVESHGGEVLLTSEPGRGSTFRFTLPAA